MGAVGPLLILSILLVIAWLFKLANDAKQASKRKAERVAATDVRPGELREDIIRRHLGTLRESSNHYVAQDATIRVIRDVMVAEGAVAEAPDSYERLHRWQRRSGIRQEYKDLATAVERRMDERLRSLADERRATEESNEVEAAKAIMARSKDTIEIFFKVAERKVATLDEYGEENWDALSAEVQRCVMKIGSREGVQRAALLPLFDPKNSPQLWSMIDRPNNMRRWRIVAEYLDAECRHRHAANAASPRTDQDPSTMTGGEFETFVANVLKAKGFTSVRGTPVTGDQGADLIAEKDGRTIIIQAKRYQGSVGNGAVQEVIAARTFYKGDEAWVVTNSTFTRAAVALAQSAGVRLVDGIELRKLAV